MDDTTKEAEATALPKADENGVALHGDYPLNSRLRAEALARAEQASDPNGLIDDDLIANTAERLAAEDADQREAEKAAPSMSWTAKALKAAAERLNIAVPEGADKAAILAAIEAPGAPVTEG